MRLIFVMLCAAGLGFAEKNAPRAMPLSPRRVTAKDFYVNLVDKSDLQHLIIKFTEQAAIRAGETSLFSVSQSDMRPFHNFLIRHPGAHLRRQNETIPESVFDEWERSGQQNSARDLANLNNFYVLELSSNPDPLGVLREVLDLDIVETAWYRPKVIPACMDIAPSTPNWQTAQGYLGPAPSGLDAVYASTYHTAGNGNPNAACVVIDYEFVGDHEDLPSAFTELPGDSGNPSDTNSEHGDGCAGILFSCNNGYGMTGMSPAARAYGMRYSVFPDYVNAIEAAVAMLNPGESLSMSVQSPGPDPGYPCDPTCGDCSQFRCIPLEYWDDVFAAVQTATANGIIVYAAAGNGQMDLDSPIYGGRFQRGYRDSGCIIVGAAHPFPVEPTCWADHGSRVDLNAWGESVCTLGGGNISGFDPAGDRRQFYTSYFGGSSAATPMVCGAGNDLQGISQIKYGVTLSPAQMLSILRDTGTPQQGSHLIGPRPNLQAAIHRILPDVLPFAATGWFSPLVPRSADSADSTACDLTPLQGNAASTYINVSVWDSAFTPAPDAGSSGVTAVVSLDGQPLDTVRWSPRIASRAAAFANNSGPFAVRGGRHTLSLDINPTHAFDESSEDNNRFYLQYVWSPLQLTAPNDYVIRAAPPLKSWGDPAVINGDGFRISPSAESVWLGCAVLPQQQNDVDLYAYPDSFSSTYGFQTVQCSSVSAAGRSELILINGNIVSPVDHLVQAVRGNDASILDYSIEVEGSTPASRIPPFTTSKQFASEEILDIYELHMEAGIPHMLSVTDVGPRLDLSLAVYSPDSAFCPINGAIAMADSHAAGGSETLAITPAVSGSFAAVVMKASSQSYGIAGGYTFYFEQSSAAPPPSTLSLVILPDSANNRMRLIWNHAWQDSTGNPPMGRRYVIYRSTNLSSLPAPGDSIGGTSDSSFVDSTATDSSSFYVVKVKAE